MKNYTVPYLENDNIESSSSFSTENLMTDPQYASSFRFECSSGIKMIQVEFTDFETQYVVTPRMSIPGSLIQNIPYLYF